MSHSAVTPAPRVLLDEESIRRTLSRIAHEIIERNADLDTVALVGIHTRGVPIAQRLRRLVEERTGEAFDDPVKTCTAQFTIVLRKKHS